MTQRRPIGEGSVNDAAGGDNGARQWEMPKNFISIQCNYV